MSGGKEGKNEHRDMFIEESHEYIQDWEDALLVLEKSPSAREPLDKLLRALHTLKGSAGFVSFDNLQTYTHELESVLQEVRDEGRNVSAGFIDSLFCGLDTARQMIEAFGKDKVIDAGSSKLIERIKRFHTMDGGMEEEGRGRSNNLSSVGSEPSSDHPAVYCIDIEIEADKKEAYLRALLIQNKLEEIGNIITVKPTLEELRLSEGEFTFSVVVETDKAPRMIKKQINIDQVKVLGLTEIVSEEERTGEDAGSGVSKEGTDEAGRRKSRGEEVVRVPVEKLDTMLNLVGELVVHNSGFISTTNQLKNQFGRGNLVMDLEEKTESLAKIARDLQDAVMKVRMLPVASVFTRFNRVVRDLAKDRGKKIEFEIFGEETEVDKKVMDRIGEPLIHLVRNAVDHGIESRDDRLKAGKSEAGHLRLSAYQEGDHICIEVSDDGRGLNRKKIIEKALQKKLIRKEEAGKISDEEVYSLIFLPGFSTAEEITDLSGRGVGLDVVKSAAEDMGGIIRIKSKEGEGTATTITLPLTMAIIPAIMVEAASTLFAIPLSLVREIVKSDERDFKCLGSGTVINLRDEVLSLVQLRRVLKLPGMEADLKVAAGVEIPIVIVDYEGRKIGIGVERLLGKEEIVIKSLSKHFREIEGLVGASIMGDGRIALILDVETMVRRYYKSDVKEKRLSVTTRERLLTELEHSTIPVEETEAEEVGSREDDGMDPVDLPVEILSDRQMEILSDIHTCGATNASAAMSGLLGREVSVSFPETKLIGIGDVATELGGEEHPVGGLYVEIDGDIKGGVLLVLPSEQVLGFCDVLYQREEGSTKEVSEEEMSGLTEFGNILSASFINAMAETTGLSVHPRVPEMSIDMCLPVIDSVLARFNQPGEFSLLTAVELFYGNTEKSICHLLLFLDPGSMELLFSTLEGMAEVDLSA
jgi:two-component system chemotaxis sensor kinase CheA